MKSNEYRKDLLPEDAHSWEKVSERQCICSKCGAECLQPYGFQNYALPSPFLEFEGDKGDWLICKEYMVFKIQTG